MKDNNNCASDKYPFWSFPTSYCPTFPAMTSALYLENYLDGLEHLPAELRRNFTLMRELDNRVQTLMKSIDKECNDFMKNASADNVPVISEDGRRDKLKAIQDMFNKAKQLGDDKVSC